MARKIMCKRCKEKFDKEELLELSNKKYCEVCYNLIVTERQERENLYNYIKEIYNIAMPTGYMLKQIKEFQENGLKLKGMLLTLQYCKEVKKMDFNIKFGLSFISYSYYEARDFYIKQLERQKKHTNVEIIGQTVYIKRKPIGLERKKRMINMEDLIND